MISIVLILTWIWADRYLQVGRPAYGWLLLVYVTVLFCGSYFVRLGFFMKSVCSAKTTNKVLALTFDDGPDKEKTARILDILKEHNMPAAFFCIGKNIPGNEAVLNRIVAEGHIIGNHSYSHHRFFDLFSSKKMQEDLQRMSRVCQDITGLWPRFFRPPYGVTNPNVKKAVLRGGFTPIGWTIRSYDTIIKNPEKLENKILHALKPGAILLLHDTSDTTLQMLPQLLQGIRNNGYQIIRLDKMINLIPYA
jgi:peptidoglycan/xylan/chitin deacetylase (PgdA/CDA1 family)